MFSLVHCRNEPCNQICAYVLALLLLHNMNKVVFCNCPQLVHQLNTWPVRDAPTACNTIALAAMFMWSTPELAVEHMERTCRNVQEHTGKPYDICTDGGEQKCICIYAQIKTKCVGICRNTYMHSECAGTHRNWQWNTNFTFAGLSFYATYMLRLALC